MQIQLAPLELSNDYETITARYVYYTADESKMLVLRSRQGGVSGLVQYYT
jgi:hypothetical protein